MREILSLFLCLVLLASCGSLQNRANDTRSQLGPIYKALGDYKFKKARKLFKELDCDFQIFDSEVTDCFVGKRDDQWVGQKDEQVESHIQSMRTWTAHCRKMLKEDRYDDVARANKCANHKGMKRVVDAALVFGGVKMTHLKEFKESFDNYRLSKAQRDLHRKRLALQRQQAAARSLEQKQYAKCRLRSNLLYFQSRSQFWGRNLAQVKADMERSGVESNAKRAEKEKSQRERALFLEKARRVRTQLAKHPVRTTDARCQELVDRYGEEEDAR